MLLCNFWYLWQGSTLTLVRWPEAGVFFGRAGKTYKLVGPSGLLNLMISGIYVY